MNLVSSQTPRLYFRVRLMALPALSEFFHQNLCSRLVLAAFDSWSCMIWIPPLKAIIHDVGSRGPLVSQATTHTDFRTSFAGKVVTNLLDICFFLPLLHRLQLSLCNERRGGEMHSRLVGQLDLHPTHCICHIFRLWWWYSALLVTAV